MNSAAQNANSLEEASHPAANTNEEVQTLKRQTDFLTKTFGIEYANAYRAENEARQNNLTNMRKARSRKKLKSNNGSALSVSSASLDPEDSLINEILGDTTVAIPGATIEIDLDLIHIEGKPEHLDDSDWCEHHANQNKHFKFAMPNLAAPKAKLMYELDVYNMLKEYTLISDCSINSVCETGKVIFDTQGFTMTKKNGGEPYANIPEKKLSNYKLTVLVLAIKLLVKKKLAIVHPNGTVYKCLLDHRFKQQVRVNELKNLYLLSKTSNEKRNFFCLSCKMVSNCYVSNRSELFRDHSMKHHGVRAEHSISELEAIVEAVLGFCVENQASLSFAEQNSHSTINIIKRLNLQRSAFTESKVKAYILMLNQILKEKIRHAAIDCNYKNIEMDENDPDLFLKIQQAIGSVHTFISLTEDGLSDNKKSFESVIAHFTKLYEFVNGVSKEPVADHFMHPLSLAEISETSTEALYNHLLKVIDDTLGSFEQISAICTDAASNIEGVRLRLERSKKIVSIKCVVHLCQLYFKDALEFIAKPPIGCGNLANDDQFMTLLSSLDISREQFDKAVAIPMGFRKKYNTEIKLVEFLRSSSMEKNLFPELDNIDIQSCVNHSVNEETLGNLNSQFEEPLNTTDNLEVVNEEDIIANSQPNSYKDNLLKNSDEELHVVDSPGYNALVVYLRESKYSLQDCRKLFRILRKIASDFGSTRIKMLKLASNPHSYIAIRWNSLKEFFEPYLCDEFRPINFLLYNQSPEGRQALIPTRYWLSYEDLMFMRVLYSHLKEFSFLTKASSHDDLAPFLYKHISFVGFKMAESMLNCLKKLNIIDELHYNKFYSDNEKRFQESSTGAIVEILNLLSVESIVNNDQMLYTSILIDQFIRYKFCSGLKIDHDGHFTPSEFDTEKYFDEPGSLFKKTRSLRTRGIIKCGPFTNNPVFRELRLNGESAALHVHVGDYITTRDSANTNLLTNLNTDNSFSDVGNGKQRLLKEIIKSIKHYQNFVKLELSRMNVVSDSAINVSDLYDPVARMIYMKTRKMSHINLVIASRYSKLGLKDVMSYVINFMLSLAIHTTSNERSFSVYRYGKENYKNNISGSLFEACLHLQMCTSNTNINTLNKIQQGLATRAKRDALYSFQPQQESYDNTTAEDQRMNE